MAIKAAATPEGLVLRKIEPGGECALRINLDGSADYCADHKGPWVRWPTGEPMPEWAERYLLERDAIVVSENVHRC